MNYVKNLIKVLLIVYCFSLSACGDKKEVIGDKKEVITAEQQKLNLADFVEWPFNEKFNDKTDLEKYVLKKFGKPDSTRKWRAPLGDAYYREVPADKIQIEYESYSFEIYRWVYKKKRYEIFKGISIYDHTDLKHGINEKTTIKDIERLFGKPDSVGNYSYSYLYTTDKYSYHFDIVFIGGKLTNLSIRINIVPF